MRTSTVSLPALQRLSSPPHAAASPSPRARRPVSYDRDALLPPARSVPLARDSNPLSAGALGFDAADTGTSVSGSATPSASLHGGATVQSTIHLDGNVDLNQLALTLDLQHTDVNGLTVSLTSPSGKTVPLPIAAAHSMSGTIDLSNAFAGEPAQGDWTLTVTDSMKRDSGTLASWSLSGHGTPPSSDPGSVTLYPMPDSGPQPILDAIDSAQKTLDLSCYLITDQKVLDALEVAAKRGVTVRVMMEPKVVGATGGKSYQQKVDELTAAGVQVEPTPPSFDSAGNVDHAKFFIADGKTLMLGTGNLVKSGLGDGTTPSSANRDLWVSDTRAESVSEAETIFNDDWLRQPTAGTDFQNLIVTPDDADGKLLGLIDSAKTRLYVDNQELEDGTILEHLIAAKQRGVDVEVLCAKPSSKTTKDRNAAAVAQLQAAGVKALEVSHYYMHAKAIVSDETAFVGSQNFSTDGLKRNRELGDLVADPTLADQLAKIMTGDYQAGVVRAAQGKPT